jgi:hypothetical protein
MELELIEPKKEARKRQSRAGKIVSDAFDSIFKKDHHSSKDKDAKKKRNSKKEDTSAAKGKKWIGNTC